MEEELKEILRTIKNEFWSNLDILNRSKSIYLVDACNLKDKNWINITPIVSSLTINHTDDGHSTINLSLNNRHFELTGKGLITENFGVRVFIGYRDIGLFYQKEFVIDMPKAGFPESGFPKISLSGKDMLVESSDNEDIQVYDGGTNEFVAKKIAESHGWEYENNFGYYDRNGNFNPDDLNLFYNDEDWRRYASQSDVSHGRRVRSAKSEYQFMKEMAIESGNVLYVSSRYDKTSGECITRLHYHKPKPKREITELWYRCPFNPLLNNVLSATPGEITYKRGQSISSGSTDIHSGNEIFSVSRGNRTPLDVMMIEDDFNYPKNPYDYNTYGDQSSKRYKNYSSGRRKSGSSTSTGDFYKRRAIYETLSAIERGRIPDEIKRKYRHIPHLLKQTTFSDKILENIDSAGHFIIELDVKCIYGLPYLNVSDIVRMRGLKFYDGLYYIKSISHSISESEPLKTSLSLRGNSTYGIKGDDNYDNDGNYYSEKEPGNFIEEDLNENPDEDQEYSEYGKKFQYQYKHGEGYSFREGEM